jgi:hypothetical protein
VLYKVKDPALVEQEFKVARRRRLYLLDSAWTTKKEAQDAQWVRRRVGDLARIKNIYEVHGSKVLVAYAVYFDPGRVLEIISTHLSDGRLLRITFFNGYYTVMRTAEGPLLAPEIKDRLTREEADEAFVNALRDDVLEREA